MVEALLSLILLALAFAGCGATATDAPGGADTRATQTSPMLSSQGSYADVPVVLHNPAPGTLDVSMGVSFNQSSGDTDLEAEVDLNFSSGGHIVQFAGDERVTCDGVGLSSNNRIAEFQVLHAPAAQMAGKTVHCEYTASGAVAGIALQIPTAPTITSPQALANVVRSAETLVTYHFDAAAGSIRGIVALGPPTSRLAKAIAKLNTPSPWHAIVDTSTFAPGAGSLVLTMSLTPHDAASGAPFKSMHAFGDATVPVPVTWV